MYLDMHVGTHHLHLMLSCALFEVFQSSSVESPVGDGVNMA